MLLDPLLVRHGHDIEVGCWKGESWIKKEEGEGKRVIIISQAQGNS